MLPFKRILFPVDFSQQSIGAAHYVEALTGRFDAQLTLLHVIEPPNYNDTLMDRSAQRKHRMDGFLAKELAYFKVERVVAEGDPATNILKIATAKQADVIMMPTHGHGAFRRFLLGSVTAKVLHDADCPVWTGVHLEQAPPLDKLEFRNFLCAVNLDAHGKKVFESALEFADEYRAHLTVVHAAGSEGVGEARRRLEELMAPSGGKASIVVEPGEVAHLVANTASRIPADMLLIGRSPSPGVFGRLRTHAYPIIRQSPCPVISV
jgi:nucleotide-binding universal stress UspA family protein